MTAADLVLVLIASAGLLAPAAAGAAPGGPPRHADARPGPRVAEPAHSEAGPASDTREADRHFRAGVALFKGAKYADALAEFERAYAIAPHPLVLYNIATCHRKLSHFAEAATAYLRFLADGKGSVPAAQLAAAQAELDAVVPWVAQVTVKLAPPSDAAVLVVDGAAIDRPTSPLILSPGEHRLIARVSGRRDAERTVTVAAGDRISVELATAELAAPAVTPPRPVAPSAAVVAHPGAGLAPSTRVFAIGAGFGTNLRLAGETGAPSLGAAVALGARLELGLDAVIVAYAIVPSIRVRIAGDDLALHAIGAVPYSFGGAMSERFAAPAIGLGLRYWPTSGVAVRLEGYLAFAGRARGIAIPMFLGAERWF